MNNPPYSASDAAVTPRSALQTMWCIGLLAALASLPAAAQPATRAAAAPAVTPSSNAKAYLAGAQYLIGPGDVIRINVYQNPDLNVETRVNDSGVISYPLLGEVDLSGLTVSGAEARISSLLKAGDIVKAPQVNIVIMQVRANQVNVLGQVARPGRVPLDIVGIRLTEILARSGGITDGGSDTVVVTGMRGGKPFYHTMELSRVYAPSGQAEDIVMQPGDSVWVDRMPIVYLYGEVQRPGQIRLERGMSVMQALAAAGGPTQRGTQKGLRIHRRGADGRVEVFEPALSDSLANGDVVYVKESLF